MIKKLPTKRDPLFSGISPLDVGEDDEDMLVLTDEQKMAKFMSDYQIKVHPLTRYKKYFDTSAKEINHIFRDIKIFYKKLVLHGNWTEKVYVQVLDEIMTNMADLNVISLDRMRLKLERKNKNSNRRRR